MLSPTRVQGYCLPIPVTISRSLHTQPNLAHYEHYISLGYRRLKMVYDYNTGLDSLSALEHLNCRS